MYVLFQKKNKKSISIVMLSDTIIFVVFKVASLNQFQKDILKHKTVIKELGKSALDIDRSK